MSVVLIVEDEILEQDFLRTVVQDELHPEDTLLTCESGMEAISLAKQHRPDIIIMDVKIPELDGIAAIEEIRSFYPPHASLFYRHILIFPMRRKQSA